MRSTRGHFAGDSSKDSGKIGLVGKVFRALSDSIDGPSRELGPVDELGRGRVVGLVGVRMVFGNRSTYGDSYPVEPMSLGAEAVCHRDESLTELGGLGVVRCNDRQDAAFVAKLQKRAQGRR